MLYTVNTIVNINVIIIIIVIFPYNVFVFVAFKYLFIFFHVYSGDLILVFILQNQYQRGSEQRNGTFPPPTATVSKPPQDDTDLQRSLSMPPPPPPPEVPIPAPTPAPTTVGAEPASTSSPKRVPLPDYSPISDDLGVLDSSKCNIVMGDSTINASSIMGTGAISSPDEIDGSQPVQKLDPSASAEQESHLQANDANQQLFPENCAPLDFMTHTKRITLAYKYFPFERKVVSDDKPVSEARTQETVVKKPEDATENSFPISSYILESWNQQGKAFKQNLQQALVMDQLQPQEGNAEASKGDEPSVVVKKSDQFLLHSQNLGSILRGKPVKKQQDFFYNEDKFAAFTKADDDLATLLPNASDRSTFTWQPQLTLSSDEIKHIQLACAYGLYAESHASAYLRASNQAVDKVLVKFDPETHQEDISTLHDLKYLLNGVVGALEQNVRMLVYIHSGLTAQMRANFLLDQGDSIPVHIKQRLLHQMLGGTGLFNSKISQFLPDIEKHRAKQAQEKRDAAIDKTMDRNNNRGRGNDRRGNNSGQQQRGRPNTRSQHQDNSNNQYVGNQFPNRGGRGGANRGNFGNRGRGGHTNSNNGNNRGGSHGNRGGSKPRKHRN